MFRYIWKTAEDRSKFENFILGFVTLVDALVLILSFGFFGSSFQFYYTAAKELKRIRKLEKLHREKKEIYK
jgi:hypothetical protein